MTRDAVLEVNIENPAAGEAFINFWRTMEAQGHQYGYEALCSVWVGFDAARSTLARQVLETVDLQRLTDIDYCCDKTISNVVLPALRDLFQREGVEVGGEGSRST
jgi:hypothetical protein